MRLEGLAGDASPTYQTGLYLRGYVAATPDTTHTAAGHGVIRMIASKKSGTSPTALATNENILSIENNGSTRLIVDADGDLFIDGTESSYDSYNDVELIRGFEQSMAHRDIDRSFESWLSDKRSTLQEVGILSPDPGSYFYNVTRLQRLQNGALWQLHQRIERLENALRSAGTEVPQ